VNNLNNILRGARFHQLRGGFIKQDEIFEEKELNGQSEKLKKNSSGSNSSRE
jgi:hypothetical protein